MTGTDLSDEYIDVANRLTQLLNMQFEKLIPAPKTSHIVPNTFPHLEARDVRGYVLREGWRSEVALGNTVQETNRTRPDQPGFRWKSVQSTSHEDAGRLTGIPETPCPLVWNLTGANVTDTVNA